MSRVGITSSVHHASARARSIRRVGHAPRRRSRSRRDSRDRRASNGEPLSIRSFMSSKGSTSPTISAPTGSQAGRPVGKAVLDHPLGEGLGDDRPGVLARPAPRRPRAMSASVVAGTMRSTMVQGKATSPLDAAAEIVVEERGEARDDPPRDRRAVGRQVVAGHDTVKGTTPAARRRRSASTRRPGAVRRRGAGSARSACMSGWSGLRSPVAGSWQ